MGDFDLTIGPVLIGLFFNTYLYGLVGCQFHAYKDSTFNDRKWIKGVVLSLFIVDTMHSVIAVYAAWQLCVQNYNNLSSLDVVSWTVPYSIVSTSLSALISQCFLGYRVFSLTQSKVLAAFIAVTSAVGNLFAVFAGIYSGILKLVSKFGSLRPYLICWLSLQVAADLCITSSLGFVVAQSWTAFHKTESTATRTARAAIQTGLFVSLFALANLFSYLFAGKSSLYLMFAFPIGRIYTNAILTGLNARTPYVATTMGDTRGTDTTINFNTKRKTIHSIQVQKEVVTSHDGDVVPSDLKYYVAAV